MKSCLTPLDAPHDEGVEGRKKPLLIVEEDASVTMKGWAGYVCDIIGLTGGFLTSRTAHNFPKRKEVTNDRRACPPRSIYRSFQHHSLDIQCRSRCVPR